MVWLLCLSTLLAALLAAVPASGEAREASVVVSLNDRRGPLRIDQMALGQGGLSPEPMWDSRVAEIRALRPKLIRLFVQEYFDLLPARGRYQFRSLDRSVDTILRTGAKPLMCLCFKPRALFPHIDQDVVEPSDYAEWDRLIYNLVKHYRDRGAGIRYWEVGNEPDIGESGGCPYRFQPESYARYYRHTAQAIRKADPNAKVGGPALASVHSPILPALLEAAERDHLPLDFVSWHTYTSDPGQVRQTIDYARGLLARHPALKPEMVLDEWNMDLMNPPLDPRFQPCYLLETVWQMKDAGLDWSCYYQIRDYHVADADFAPFMSPEGTAFMARWWNRMPQFDGLFDYQDNVRPSYFAFKLLSRLAGDRLALTSSDSRVHGLAAYDDRYRMWTILVWNFSPEPATVTLDLQGVPHDATLRHVTLDPLAPSGDENARLRPDPPGRLTSGDHRLTTTLDAYGVQYWSLE